jgi:hypothetical protein
MARLFGAATSDRTTFTQGGGFTGLDNLAQGNFTYGVVGRRTSDNNNLYLGGKNPGSSTTAGWEFLVGFDVGGTTPGHLRLLVWTSGTRYDVSAGASAANDVTGLNQHEMMVVTWTSGGTVKMYRSPIENPILEVAGYTNNTTPSGTTGTDSTGNLTAWNNARGGNANSWIGDGSWVFVYNRVLSKNELQTVQAGILTYRAGVEANDSATKTRGVNMMKSVSGYVMLNYQDASGNFTEYSGNNITASGTGTFTAGAESANWYAPTSFEDDLETTLAEQTTYRYTSEFARFTVSSSATAFTAWYKTTLDPSTYPNQAVLAYALDNALPTKLSSPVLNATASLNSTVAAYNTGSVTGLTGSSKAISLINGVRSHPNGVPAPYQGTFLTLAQFNASSSFIAPPATLKRMVVINDSIGEGFLADCPQQYSGFQTVRRSLPNWIDAVQMWGAGGNALYDYFQDASTTSGSVSRITSGSGLAAVVIELMINDHGRAYWSSTTAKSALIGGINLLLPQFSGPVYLIPMTPTTNESATSTTYGETYSTWRTMLSTVPALTNSPSRVIYVDTMTDPWINTATQMGDSVHPNTAGQQAIGVREQTLFASDPTSTVNRFIFGANGSHANVVRITTGTGTGVILHS